MSNMSYCRFSNTLADLEDCRDSLDDTPPEELSDGELAAFNRMVQVMKDFLEDWEGEL